jgi:hypothetical protein
MKGYYRNEKDLTAEPCSVSGRKGKIMITLIVGYRVVEVLGK